MRSWLKAMLCITLSLMCLFTCVGYAALSTSLSIKGSAASEMIEINVSNIQRKECDDNETLA